MTVLNFPERLVSNNTAEIPAGYCTSAELVRRTELTYRQIDYWTRTDRIHSINLGEGSGTLRLYPVTEIPVACLMSELLQAGVALNPAHDTARALLEHGQARLGPYTIHLPEEP